MKIEKNSDRIRVEKVVDFTESSGIEISVLRGLEKKFYENWREALRSGKYHQVNHTLCEEKGGYCCLGVIGKEYGYTDEILQHTGYLETIGDRIVRIPRVARINGEFNSFFAALNDKLLLTFEEIAQVIDYIIEHELYRQD